MNHLLFRFASHVSACASADISQPVPFIHAEFADSNFNVETIVILDIDTPLRKVFPYHVFMNLFASFDF